MKIHIIKKEESKYSSNIVSNKLYREKIDLNEIYKYNNIESIKILIIKSSPELEIKDKRYLDAMGGYTPNQRLLRYFLLFFFVSFITFWFLFYNHIFPEHMYTNNFFIPLFSIFLLSFFIGILGFLFDSIFSLIRLYIFERNEKKINKNV